MLDSNCVTGAAGELHASAAEQTPAVARPALNFPVQQLFAYMLHPHLFQPEFLNADQFSAQVSRRVFCK